MTRGEQEAGAGGFRGARIKGHTLQLHALKTCAALQACNCPTKPKPPTTHYPAEPQPQPASPPSLQTLNSQPPPQGGGRWRYDYAITNVEYTEFERLGIEDVAVEGSNHSVFPANTNILYVGLDAARAKVEAAVAAGGGDVLPGLIFNMKKKVRGGGWRRGGGMAIEV